MNETALVSKVWNFAHVLRDQGVPYQAYISQISYLLFLKMDDEREALIRDGFKMPPSGLPADCRWAVLRDLQGEALNKRSRTRHG
jgi:type I restriction enzyme M protein